MKRTFKRPDGTEEVLEGTAEELAEYERKLNESEKKQPKPGVLRGKSQQEEALRELAEAAKRIAGAAERNTPVPWLPYRTHPIWIVSCSVCGRVNCDGNHWAQPLYPYITLTTSVTDNKIVMNERVGDTTHVVGFDRPTWQGSIVS